MPVRLFHSGSLAERPASRETPGQKLESGSRIVVIGGGPAGAFFALHLLRRAKHAGKQLEVLILEKRLFPAARPGCPGTVWRGCNYCAGGISPRLNDALATLGLKLPPQVIQSRITSVTIQGFWKNIELDVPEGREMLAVYRGSRPDKRTGAQHGLDLFLLEAAGKAGARLVGGEALRVEYLPDHRLSVTYSSSGAPGTVDADLVVCAAGVNEHPGQGDMLGRMPSLVPGFTAPRLRPAMVFELEVRPSLPSNLANTVYFVEYGSKELPLEMCSILPKRNHLTITLVGRSVDDAVRSGRTQHLIRDFLALPHVRKLIPPGVRLAPVCGCHPNLVVGSANWPFANRVAAVGDMVTTRLYKDGILSACQTADALAATVLERGIDRASLKAGYRPVLRRFRRNNRVAALVFLIHRIFFSSSMLSRVLYQAAITERKTTTRDKRRLEKILWNIASGDDDYREIFRSMLDLRTVWSVLTGGVLVTLRNYVTELFFGLRWEGFGRFTTGVALERLEEKRSAFSKLIAEARVTPPGQPEFERMYTIRVHAARDQVLEQLGRFGEPDRGYLRPRWLHVLRVAGEPNTPGCVIRYNVVHPALSFSLMLEQIAGGHLAVYRVQNGFARAGILIFEIETLDHDYTALSIYVAFNFARGRTPVSRVFWWLFRHLFPSFVHDVLWNHSLCQMKDLVEGACPHTAAAEVSPLEPGVSYVI